MPTFAIRSRSAGFTLIELMISIALSAIILLVAVSAFRQASQTMALMNRLSIENGMLRTGYLVSVTDCDYWSSLANPNYPYLKGYMSDPVPTLGGNNAANKRVFKEVHFSKGSPVPVAATATTNFDPNWDLPHDVRSWYRNYLLPSYRSYRPVLSEPDAAGAYLYLPYYGDSARDANGGVCEAWLDGFGQQVFSSYCVASPGWAIGGHNSGQFPIGWGDLWHIWGDYSVVSNIGDVSNPTADAPRSASPFEGPDGYARAAGDPLNADSPKVRGARPRLMFELFRELGHVGVYTYMPPGTLNIIQAPSYNNTPANIALPDNHWCKGEIPWALTPPTKVGTRQLGWWRGWVWNPTYAMPSTVAHPSTSEDPRNNTGDYQRGMPGPAGKLFDEDLHPPAETYGNSMPDFLGDLELCNSEFFQDNGWTGGYVARQSRETVGLLIGHKFVPQDLLGTAYDSKPLIDDAVVDPFRRIYADTYDTSNMAAVGEANSQEENSLAISFGRQSRNYGSETVHVPRNFADDPSPNLDDKPRDVPMMSTTTTRFRIKGADKMFYSVRVFDPTTGRSTQLSYSLIGTTLRGARQHWGWKTHYDVPTMKKMGDVYDK